jgi:hypothetical protein
MAVRHCITFRRTLYSDVESPTIALGWVCFDCRKDRERKDVLSHAECPRCNSNDKEAIASVGDNYNLRCKHYEWTESWRPSMTKENKPSPGSMRQCHEIVYK